MAEAQPRGMRAPGAEEAPKGKRPPGAEEAPEDREVREPEKLRRQGNPNGRRRLREESASLDVSVLAPLRVLVPP